MRTFINFLLVFFVLLVLMDSETVNAKRYMHERIYQEQWCKSMRGSMEVRLEDKTRVDCLTQSYAVEFDFADKWAESIGQALHYANMTNKQAMVVLILENPSDQKYYKILDGLIRKSCLDVKLQCIGKESSLCIIR